MMKGFLALLLLGFEAALLFRGRFKRDKRFAWAPYDEITEYELTLFRNGVLLDADQVRRALHMPARGRENRALGDLIDHVETWMERKGGNHDVLLRYRVNGGPEQLRTFTGKEN